jgi:1,6-anhydro-N-acetylmuramate kinase
MIETDPPMNNIYIGIMSGTSVDAIDLVAITIKGDHFNIAKQGNLKKSLNWITILESNIQTQSTNYSKFTE